MSVTDKSQKQSGGLGETVSVIIQALILALVIRTFLFQPFSIPSGSMRPTLLEGDYLFVTKWAYGYSRYSLPFAPDIFSGRIWGSAPKRGDVVVFKFPPDPSLDYIKRVIGLPGDRVQMKHDELYINGTVVLDRFGNRYAHLLVIARRHVEHATQLSWLEYSALQRLAYEANQALEKVVEPQRVFIAALGARDPLPMTFSHFHLHVLPVPQDDERCRPADGECRLQPSGFELGDAGDADGSNPDESGSQGRPAPVSPCAPAPTAPCRCSPASASPPPAALHSPCTTPRTRSMRSPPRSPRRRNSSHDR